jgi:DNA polymerase-3 subunit alpha
MIKILREVTTQDLEQFIYNIDVKDPNLYMELQNSNKIGLFQINGKTAERLCDEVKPENFDELIAINALARPGPMEAAAPYYVERKRGAPSPYPEKVNEIIKDTHHTFIYQEQIMEAFHKIGGFTLEEANEVRGLMKKLGKLEKNPEDVKKWDKVVKRFIHGATRNGINDETAKKIAEDLTSFSGYSFNKSHATSYSYIAAITIYLSFYFRPYYYSSVLAYEVDREVYLFGRLCSVKEQGIRILPPEINLSHEHFFPNGDYEIRFGLNDIKYVSENPTKIILEHRPYRSLFEFIIKTRDRAVTSRVITALISVGAFDEIEKCGRVKLLTIFNSFWEQKKQIKIAEKLKQLWDECFKVANSLPGLETTKQKMIEFEKEYFGFKFFTSPFTDERIDLIKKLEEKRLIYSKLTEVREASRKVPVCLNSIRSFRDKNGNDMAFIEVEDIAGNRMSIPVFQSYYKYVKYLLVENELYLMNLYLDDRDKVLFGKSGRMSDEFNIRRLIKKI